MENGVKVYITARKADACDAVASDLSKIGECISIPGDISRLEEIDRLGAEIERHESKLDILVNNAGASWGADFVTFPESGWDKVMDINVKTAFFLTQRLFKLLHVVGSPEDYARVINIGAIEGMRTLHLEAYSYAASKAAILHLTRMMKQKATSSRGKLQCGAGGARRIWREWQYIWLRTRAAFYVGRPSLSMTAWLQQDNYQWWYTGYFQKRTRRSQRMRTARPEVFVGLLSGAARQFFLHLLL